MSRSVNTAIIIGNLTRDPEMRYTPGGHAVTSFAVATNRVFKTADGERREDVEFHNVVAWNKLAEICSQYLSKGRKVYVRGRLQTRKWEAKDGSPRQRTEIVAEDMVILDSRGGGAVDASMDAPAEAKKPSGGDEPAESVEPKEPKDEKDEKDENVDPKEMPF
jgi:single-strand DNA-binding protein